MISDELAARLVTRALSAREKAYAPYSRFTVGAAVLAASGEIYCGANVENASYPAGICAERSAIFHAVAMGERRLSAIALCGGKEGGELGACFPCGICRQVMREFCDPEQFIVIVATSPTDWTVHTLARLLPDSFGPESLG
jgi:cytidine deaminase